MRWLIFYPSALAPPPVVCRPRAEKKLVISRKKMFRKTVIGTKMACVYYIIIA